MGWIRVDEFWMIWKAFQGLFPWSLPLPCGCSMFRSQLCPGLCCWWSQHRGKKDCLEGGNAHLTALLLFAVPWILLCIFHLYLHPALVCPCIFCFLSKCKNYPWGWEDLDTFLKCLGLLIVFQCIPLKSLTPVLCLQVNQLWLLLNTWKMVPWTASYE